MTKIHLQVIHDDFQTDRVTDLLLALSPHEDILIDSIKLSEFLSKNGVYYDKTAYTLRIPHDSHGLVQDTVILSRVIDISPESVKVISGDTSGLYKGQVLWAYMNLIQNNFACLSESGLYSSVGTVLPLPTQWGIFEELKLSVLTPQFIYTYGSGTFDYSCFEHPIVKSPYDFYSWKPGCYVNEKVDKFAVERPLGVPVVTYVTKNRAWHVHMSSDHNVIVLPTELLDSVARQVWEIFGGLLLEILWFVDKSTVTFACASHYCASLRSFEMLNGFMNDIVQMCNAISDSRIGLK